VQPPDAYALPLALLPGPCQTMYMSSPLAHLYLDHSAVAHEPWWPQIDAILASGRVTLALSLWNLVEIGIATNLEQRERRLAFLEKHKPLWIVERVGVQRPGGQTVSLDQPFLRAA
jgi:hypothetical protein